MALCKSAATIRNTYEIRLALYMAVKQRLTFILGIRPGASVAPDLCEHLNKHDGKIQEVASDEFSVSFGHVTSAGTEGRCWVLGDSSTHRQLLGSLHSQWLRERLEVNSQITAAEAPQLEAALRGESLECTNIDDENVRDALAALCRELKSQGGFLFVQ